MVVNAIVAGVHYILIYVGVVSIKGEVATVTQSAFADLIVTIIPSIVGAYGLWQLKKWGWALCMVACGGYLPGMVALLTQAVAEARYGFMNLVSLYFLLSSVLLLIYLWQEREIFSAEYSNVGLA